MVCLTDLYAALFGLFIARRYIRSEFSSMKSCMICCETTQMLWMVRAAFRLFIRRVRKYGRRKAYTCACVFMESPLTSRFVSGLPHLPHLLHPPRHPVLHFRRRAYPSLPPSLSLSSQSGSTSSSRSLTSSRCVEPRGHLHYYYFRIAVALCDGTLLSLQCCANAHARALICLKYVCPPALT